MNKPESSTCHRRAQTTIERRSNIGCRPTPLLSKISSSKRASASCAVIVLFGALLFAGRFFAQADNTPQALPFSQNWSNAGLIANDDIWSGVAGIEGFRGDGLTGGTAVDPQTVLAADDPGVLDVIANQNNPNTLTTGGVAEFALANPTIALQGSGTARAPYIKLYLNTTGRSSINVSYNIRDIDGSADNAVQPVALQFRIGSSGAFTNVAAGFVADATTGPSLATLVTPVSVTLPVAAENQMLVQVRIITTDAVGSDEWVGIDEISVTGVSGGTTNPSGVGAASPSTIVQGGSTLLTVTVTPGTNPASTGLVVTGDLTSVGGSGTQPFFDDGTNGDVIIGNNVFSFQATVAVATTIGMKSLPVSIADSQARTGNTSIPLTVTSATPLRIHDIQGTSHISPVAGNSVSGIPGVVTGLRSNGFFMQDPVPDSNDATSEGMFVFTATAPGVSVGHAVSVSGTVSEFRGSPSGLTNTEIGSPTIVITSTGNPLPPAIVVGTGGRIPPDTVIDDDSTGDVETGGVFDPASDGIDFFESLEGMQIQVNNAVAVGPRTDANEIAVVGDNGASASVRTSRGGIVIRTNDFNPERIIVDDTLLAGSTPSVNVGDTFTTSVVGILDYSGGNFRLLATTALTAISGGLAQEATTPQATNEVAIATFNVENLDPSDGSPKFNTLAGLIVNNLKSPDIICVEEVQDNDGATNSGTVDASVTYGMLISAVQAAGGPTYQVRQINPVNGQDGGEPGGNIRQIFMFRTDRGVAFIDRPGGGSTIATSVVSGGSGPELSASPGRIDPTNTAFNSSRKPLAGEFTFNGQRLFLIGNHFNSKGGDDPLYGHDQPPIRSSETTRIQQAQTVKNFVDAILAVDANADVIVLGDLNDFEFSTAINTLKGGVLTPLIESLPQNERYSYNFEGNAQVLDHIMASNNLFNDVPFVYDVVHINSEFAVQSSDHDPSVARFTFAPTASRLAGFEVEAYGDQALLQWQTAEEVDNLGFNIYRDENGKRVRLNPQILAGSALLAGTGIELKAGRSYSWWDGAGLGRADSRYWLEELDLDGNSTWHGPVKINNANGKTRSPLKELKAVMLNMLGRDQLQYGITRAVERSADIVQPGETMRLAGAQLETRVNLAAQKAVKISINHEGWYRVTQPELVRAGIDPKSDPRNLQLFVDGLEQPIVVTGQSGSEFGPSDAIEFYGIGLDTASTNSRVYWLVAGSRPGLRVQSTKGAAGKMSGPSFAYTVERKDRTVYFSALRNGDKENFFGAVVTREPVDQELTLLRVDKRSAGLTILEVALQGVTQNTHNVQVILNGSAVGEASFNGQGWYVAKLPVSQALLKEGANVVRLSAQGVQPDVSLIDYIRMTYQRGFTASNNTLRFTAAGKQQVTIDGFTENSIRVFDVTRPDAVQEVSGVVRPHSNGFEVTVAVQDSEQRTLLAITNDRRQRPESITANLPSNWRGSNQSADLVIVTHNSLLTSARLLQAYRENQGLRVALVDIEDVYDEFAFGNKSPYALRSFLGFAKANWARAPQFVLLIGDASLDPKDYFGRGDFDLVPTKLLDTRYMETASDDWFASNDSSEQAAMSVGRLAVRGEDEAGRMISKIIGYEQSTGSQGVLLVSDANDGFNFEAASDGFRDLIPPDATVEQIYRGRVDEAAAKKALFGGLSRGQKIVHYAGHGSMDSWRGNLLSSAEARGLTNRELPLFVMMTCLNGYFHEVSVDSLAESLMKAELGGAIAVWASSGLTIPSGQTEMTRQAFSALFGDDQKLTLGEITLRAKAAVHDSDVRRTWILFGDPTTRIKR